MPQNEPRNTWIVIPAYNEEALIGDVIGDLKTHGYDNILVVDDGSRDQTAAKAREAGVETLRLLINRGQGGALRAGIRYLAAEYSPDIIVTFDSDGQHQAKDIAGLIQPIEHGEADIVLGSRFLNPVCQIPGFRRVVLKLAVLFTNILSHVRLSDTHNGLRALNRKAYESIAIIHRGMEHASDIIEEISRKKLRYAEAPVHVVYTDYARKKGQRSLGFIKMGIKIILRKLM